MDTVNDMGDVPSIIIVLRKCTSKASIFDDQGYRICHSKTLFRNDFANKTNSAILSVTIVYSAKINEICSGIHHHDFHFYCFVIERL